MEQNTFLTLLRLRLMQRFAHTGIYQNTELLPNLFLSRFDEPRQVLRHYSSPAFVLFSLGSGTHQVRCSGQSFDLSAGMTLAGNLYTSCAYDVIHSTKEDPACFINVPLQNPALSEVLARLPELKLTEKSTLNCLETGEASVGELTALTALLEVLLAPPSAGQHAGIELTLKALYYQLLQGPHAAFICRSFTLSGHSGQLMEVICTLSENFTKPQSIEDLAARACMSVSNFYRCFKQITSLSPQQYIKRLRLYEARRLLLTENYSVLKAALTVGYPSRGSFTQDYKRLFGHLPQEDCRPG